MTERNRYWFTSQIPTTEVGQTKARGEEHWPDLTQGQQAPEHWSCHLVLSRVNVSRKLKLNSDIQMGYGSPKQHTKFYSKYPLHLMSF